MLLIVTRVCAVPARNLDHRQNDEHEFHIDETRLTAFCVYLLYLNPTIFTL